VLKDAIAQLVERKDMTRAAIAPVFEEIFTGQATPAQIGAFLLALRMKGETPQEIAGAAQVMRAKATRVATPAGAVVLDTCGTGGDGAQTFNISTAVAFIASAVGATVAKHGNRSVSSKCGSADVLSAAGISLETPRETVERCLSEIGIGFLFAPALHGVMKHVIGPRREIGVRSIFNLLGPLSNPAGATHQVLGVYDGKLVPVMAETLRQLGSIRALVVHGEDGLDEISPCGPTIAALVEDDEVRSMQIVPEDADVKRLSIESIRGGDPAENAALLRALFEGEKGPIREAVVLNAAAAIWVGGFARDLREGAHMARAALDGGHALRKLDQLIELTKSPSHPEPSSGHPEPVEGPSSHGAPANDKRSA
jgi:anthranilate phosphoribosyltransferase